MKINDIATNAIVKGTYPKSPKYPELYKKILALKSGHGFSIEMETKKEATRLRYCIDSLIRRRNLLKEFVISERETMVYVGRR